MSNWSKVPVSSFLEERKNRYSAEEANKLGLRRIEKIDFSGTIHLTNNKETRTGMILIKKGDLVISGINVEKGAIAVYDGEEDVLATIHYSSYAFDEGRLDVGYFKWLLKSRYFKDLVNSNTRGGIKTEIKPKHFLSIITPLPVLNLQIELRKRIDSVKNEIAELKKSDRLNQDYVQKLRQAMLQEAVSGKLVPHDPNDEPASELLRKIKAEKEKLVKDKKIKKERDLPPIINEEIPYELPDGWIWIRTGDLLATFDYGTSQKSYDDMEGVPVLSMGNVVKGKLNFLNLKKLENCSQDLPRLLLRNNDILFNRTNSLELVGKAGIYEGANDQLTFASYLIRIRIFDYTHPKYLNYYLMTRTFRKTQIDPEVVKQCGQANFNGTKLKKTLIPLPPLKEQKRIVEKIDQLMKLCDELEKKINENQNNSELLMEAVLKEAFAV